MAKPVPKKTDKKTSSRQRKAMACSFCRKSSNEVKKLIAGPNVYICDECIGRCQDLLREETTPTSLSELSGEYAFTLLQQFFAPSKPEQLVTASRSFPARMRVDIQLALNRLLIRKSKNRKLVGIHDDRHSEAKIPDLWRKGNKAIAIAPLQYEDVEIGNDKKVACLKNGLWFFIEEGVKCALLLTQHGRFYHEDKSIYLEFAVPTGSAGQQLVDGYFQKIEDAVNQAITYRNKILSLEADPLYSGRSSDIKVHKLLTVNRKDIILPESTRSLLDRNIIQFVKQRPKLSALGLTAKKGLLFYGPPGTGKTYTLHYLAHQLTDHTTLLLTAEQIFLLQEYMALARLLQPVILVIEDADLIAKDRQQMHNPQAESMLNTLLNEMDGLREDAQIIFILTSNRPEILEHALAGRPGRIDQAIEFPLPDDEGRRKLIRLYSKGLIISSKITNAIVARTCGVSAAFIKELMRRSAQYLLEEPDATQLKLQHIDAALQEMLFTGGSLNAKLLGGQVHSSESSS